MKAITKRFFNKFKNKITIKKKLLKNIQWQCRSDLMGWLSWGLLGWNGMNNDSVFLVTPILTTIPHYSHHFPEFFSSSHPPHFIRPSTHQSTHSSTIHPSIRRLTHSPPTHPSVDSLTHHAPTHSSTYSSTIHQSIKPPKRLIKPPKWTDVLPYALHRPHGSCSWVF